MSTDQHRSTSAPDGGNLLLLLLSLLFALLVAPVLGRIIGDRVLVYVGVTAVLFFGVFVNRTRDRLFWPSLALAVLTVSTVWSTLILGYPLLFVASCLLEAAFYATIAVILVIRILKKHLASIQSIFGAVCVYLLFGLAWAQLYWATERIDRESLTFARSAVMEADAHQETHASFSQVIYFSFVTMSTLGYGDIVPETPLAQTLAWMQSVLGQFFLAVLVAWLVSAIPSKRSGIDGSVNEMDKENDQCKD